MLINKHIKKVVIYTFLFVYGFALIKPITPIINDVIAHTFYKMEHLATVHFENGKYHVHAELASERKGEPKENVPSSIYETLAIHLTGNTVKLKVHRTSSTIIFSSKIEHTSSAFIQQPTPPPQA